MKPLMIPSIGRIVHYVLDDGPSKGEHRPAIITRVWAEKPHPGACVQLQVFTDGSNDGLQNIEWRTSVEQDPNGSLGTWHAPERTEAE